MAHFKCPTSVEFRDSLVRTATGKLQKFKLRAPYWEGRERGSTDPLRRVPRVRFSRWVR